MKTLTGIVVSDKMTKTVLVQVETRWKHPTYKKFVKSTKKFMADNSVNAKTGDQVIIQETRPLSRNKCWQIAKIVTSAPQSK